ncbi:MAG: beta-galactosidase [Ruminococcus sp.]|nr:beta-galactosidase [Ruminococcus sp.]
MSYHKAATPKFPHILHGGDYNPEQWLNYPDVLSEDIRLMKLANINCVSLGIFAWAHLEPEKDKFSFEWLDKIIDRLYENGIHVILATPSGSRPHWLADEYPEVLRVNEGGQRALYGNRHNHCYTSPAYRERVRIINTKLAERYASHPAVILWHISNEYGGDCHCELCQQAFRDWLKSKYGSLDVLNHAWWSNFWSHTYTSWEQIHSPTWLGESAIHGLDLDWKRFVTHQTIDFMKAEISAVRSVEPSVPVTANLMGIYNYFLDYYALGKELDVVSWDSYPEWHLPNRNFEVARNESLSHDMMRSVKQRSFLLMECTPSTTNWRSISKLKKPGMHDLAVMNAIAHGADSALYFQLRQSRGSAEKFHSAVISHTGTENTRVFREVAELGKKLSALSEKIYGSSTDSDVAIIFDTENKWAMDKCQGPRNAGLDYFGIIQSCYDYFWRNGINTDIVDSTYDLSKYRLVIAPMLYMFRAGIQEKLRRFVADGGILVTTAFSGVVNDTDLCFLGEATEEKLSDVTGMWVEETDSLYDGENNSMVWNGKSYWLRELCELVHPTGCEVLAEYDSDFYKGAPAMTVNRFGKGRAYHICSIADTGLYSDLFAEISAELGLEKAIDADIPDNVSASYRNGDGEKLVFLQNYADSSAEIKIRGEYTDMLTGETLRDVITLPGLSAKIVSEV